ncbi:hypothetical protein ACIRP2_13385 [Streptomyces sp. NPDC101194]|uniref:hypothetical protein n=1 Tax=Streptomyces sp. NPDC101194 TaxID=3366127 RepID=UPI00381579C0
MTDTSARSCPRDLLDRIAGAAGPHTGLTGDEENGTFVAYLHDEGAATSAGGSQRPLDTSADRREPAVPRGPGAVLHRPRRPGRSSALPVIGTVDPLYVEHTRPARS